MEMLKDNKTKAFDTRQFGICAIIIGVTLISFPSNSVTYLIVRFIQALELLIFAVLFVPRVQQVIKVDKFNLYVHLWWLFYISNTILHATDVGITPVFTWLNVAIFVLLGTTYWQEDIRGGLKALAIIFTFLTYLNAILLIFFPDGLWEDPEWIGRGSPVRYLFGNQNQTGLVCMLAISIQCIYTFAYKKGRFNLFLLLVVSILVARFHNSMTPAVGIVMMTLYIPLNRMFKRTGVWFVVFSVIYFALFMLIVWYGSEIDGVKWATRFVEGTLNKDTTFSRRTIIWENAVKLIKREPLVGYGIRTVEWNDNHLEGSGAHNLWVMLLLNSGIVGCCSFILIIIAAVRNALTVKSKATITAVISLCIMLVMSFFEAYNIVYIFLFLMIVYYSAKIPEQSSTV
ncbi:MAG: O-antigen ligase family protein [Paludibacteraceae bacterium]|nr:O-antigen ligase family protein [Paludibacteraceae bacterium]